MPTLRSHNAPAPVVLAMVICDNIHRDPSNGKCFLLGTFSSIFTQVFPCVHSMMMLYLAVTEINRRCRLKVRIIDFDEERESVFSHETEFELFDPIAVIEIIVPIAMVTFPNPGEYRLQVFAENDMIGERRILVGKIPAEQRPNQSNH